MARICCNIRGNGVTNLLYKDEHSPSTSLFCIVVHPVALLNNLQVVCIAIRCSGNRNEGREACTVIGQGESAPERSAIGPRRWRDGLLHFLPNRAKLLLSHVLRCFPDGCVYNARRLRVCASSLPPRQANTYHQWSTESPLPVFYLPPFACSHSVDKARLDNQHG